MAVGGSSHSKKPAAELTRAPAKLQRQVRRAPCVTSLLIDRTSCWRMSFKKKLAVLCYIVFLISCHGFKKTDMNFLHNSKGGGGTWPVDWRSLRGCALGVDSVQSWEWGADALHPQSCPSSWRMFGPCEIRWALECFWLRRSSENSICNSWRLSCVQTSWTSAPLPCLRTFQVDKDVKWSVKKKGVIAVHILWR